MTTYKERYLAGEIEFEEIDEYSYGCNDVYLPLWLQCKN